MSGDDSVYTPDVWEIVKITNPKGVSHYRILAGWFGGFTGSNSWKLSSGILSASLDEIAYSFPQHSGSTYVCFESSRKLNSMTHSILAHYKDSGLDIEICEENPLNIKYN